MRSLLEADLFDETEAAEGVNSGPEAELSAASELNEPVWAVVSFERIEISKLNYAQAAAALTELETQGVNGLCIVTMDAASRVRS